MAFRSGGGSSRQTCRFFLEGRCKFGDDCKFEHPRSQSQTQSSNRFNALQNGNSAGTSARGADRYRPGDNRSNLPFGLNRDHIRWDVTSGERDGERPLWPMSCYAPGRDAPCQLIEGPEYEISPEEVRVLFYLAKASGDPSQMQAYEQNERAAAVKSDQATQEIKNDPDRFIRSIIDAEKQHPNRIDQTVKNAGPWQRPPPSFNPSPSGNASFGSQQPAQPGFGAPSALAGRAPAFGAPSGLGASNNSAPSFGAPSALGGASSTPFGGPSQTGQSTGFGAPSQLGSRSSPFTQTSTQSTSAFGKPSTQGASAFGQPSAFGAAASKPSPFASTSPPIVPPNTGFGSSGFSSAQTTSPFAQGNSQTNKHNQGEFGSAASEQPVSNNAFGQPSSNHAGSFGAPSNSSSTQTFGQNGPTTSTNPFGAQQQQQQSTTNPSPFARPNGSNTAPSPFGSSQPAGSGNMSLGGGLGGFGNSSQAAPPSSATSTHHPNGTLQSWKGEPVTWQRVPGKQREPPVPTILNRTYGKPERIWFPNGPPQAPNADAEGVAASYEGEVGDRLHQAYLSAQETGTFANGIMPEVPPKQEWIQWDI